MRKSDKQKIARIILLTVLLFVLVVFESLFASVGLWWLVPAVIVLCFVIAWAVINY